MLPKRVLRRRRRAPIAPRKADLRRSCTTRQRRARPLMSSTLHTDPIGHPLQPVAWILPPFPPKSGGRAGEGGQTVKGADREGGRPQREADRKGRQTAKGGRPGRGEAAKGGRPQREGDRKGGQTAKGGRPQREADRKGG